MHSLFFILIFLYNSGQNDPPSNQAAQNACIASLNSILPIISQMNNQIVELQTQLQNATSQSPVNPSNDTLAAAKEKILMLIALLNRMQQRMCTNPYISYSMHGPRFGNNCYTNNPMYL